MQTFLKKYNIWISVAVFFVAILIAVFLAFLPIRRDIQAISNDIQKKIIDDELNRARISKIPEMERTENILKENEDKLNIILDNDNEVELIKRIEALADETGNLVALKIVEEAQASKAPSAKKGAEEAEDIKSKLPYNKFLPMQINLEGGYVEAQNFIHKLENMPYYVNVISLNMSRSDPTETKNSKDDGLFSNRSSSALNPSGKKILKTSLEVIIYLKK